MRAEAAQVGSAQDKYRLVRTIAHGGMAEIWLAMQPWPGGIEREVVIKRVHTHLAQDPRFVAMFLDEVKLAARLSHPNIVQVLDFGKHDGAYFLCMERLVGADLRTILHDCAAANRPLAPAAAATIVSALCDGLDHAHALADDRGQSYGIVHRDISPSNIFVTRQGVVKILDFGIAKVRDKAIQTEAGQLRGKIIYMFPEQAGRSADIDRRSDIFSLGTVLYEALTGVQPFLRDHQEASPGGRSIRLGAGQRSCARRHSISQPDPGAARWPRYVLDRGGSRAISAAGGDVIAARPKPVTSSSADQGLAGHGWSGIMVRRGRADGSIAAAAGVRGERESATGWPRRSRWRRWTS